MARRLKLTYYYPEIDCKVLINSTQYQSIIDIIGSALALLIFIMRTAFRQERLTSEF